MLPTTAPPVQLGRRAKRLLYVFITVMAAALVLCAWIGVTSYQHDQAAKRQLHDNWTAGRNRPAAVTIQAGGPAVRINRFGELEGWQDCVAMGCESSTIGYYPQRYRPLNWPSDERTCYVLTNHQPLHTVSVVAAPGSAVFTAQLSSDGYSFKLCGEAVARFYDTVFLWSDDSPVRTG